jgi:hypothetical protein
MTELISGFPSLPAPSGTAAPLVLTTPPEAISPPPTRLGRDWTTPQGHPNYPPCWGDPAQSRLLCY